jgi:hypothetical protein
MSSSVNGVGGELTMYLKHFGPRVRANEYSHSELGPSYLKAGVVLLLLLVDYTQSKIDLIRLFKVGLHLHDLGKRFFGVVQGTISVVEYADAIPQFGFLPRLLAVCRTRANW